MNSDQKLDKIVDTLGAQAVTLERLTVTVEEHVKRSNMQEAAIAATNKRIEPLEKHQWMVKGGVKLIGLMALLAGIAEGLAIWLRK